MKIPIKEGQYIKQISVNERDVDIEFLSKKKVALIFISLNAQYWPYLKQVVEDCRVNFLPHHKVDYFAWTDMPEEELPNVTVIPTDPVPWPHPTLMRYHLFLNEEEKLQKYDYIFYLDADMRVVQKISDEILGSDLTLALHPMYALKPQLVPPYEPNEQSQAFIPRLGRIVDENTGKGGTPEEIFAQGGKPRYVPVYLAGGFQGGIASEFLKAMHSMKESIDKDFVKNYTAIWNDESHWNKYLFEHKGPILSKDIIVLGPDYVYPDSLIKEYYEPIWGRSYEPKIITLTKPFSLSKEAGAQLNEMMGRQSLTAQCPLCKDLLTHPGHKITRIHECPGAGKPHQVDTVKV